MAEYLVTGGAGFIGSNIVQELVRRGKSVRVLDNFSTGKQCNLNNVLKDIELIEGDIRSYHIVQKAVEGVNYVLHQAALPSVPRSIKDAITTNEVNVQGTLNLLEASIQTGIKRLVFASSSSVYGNSAKLPKDETMNVDPISPYAVSKLAAERYCCSYYRIYGLATVSLRYFNVFGPNQNPHSQYSAVIPKLVHAIREGLEVTIYGDGEQSRDFTYVSNVVDANLAACDANSSVAGSVMNIACGERRTLNSVVGLIEEIAGKRALRRCVPSRPGDVKDSFAKIDKAADLLGYNPKVMLAKGLSLYCNSIETNSTFDPEAITGEANNRPRVLCLGKSVIAAVRT